MADFSALAALLDPAGLVTDAAVLEAARQDSRGRTSPGQALALARPADAAGVAAVLRWAGEAGVAVIPAGGLTGRSGGCFVPAGQNAILLSTQRLDSITDLDPATGTVRAGAGVTLAALDGAGAPHGLCCPIRMGSQGSASLGGAIATNCGGGFALVQNMMRAHLRGLEVVLADGTILNLMTPVLKANRGPDLKQLFIGSEGIYGVVTAAWLALAAAPARVETALVAVTDVAAGLELFAALRAAPLRAVELVSAASLAAYRAQKGELPPILTEPEDGYLVLLETAGGDDTVRGALEAGLAQALESGIALNAVLAQSEAQRARIWRMRDAPAEVGPGLAHDISVPPALLPRFFAGAAAALARLLPGARPVPFGHLGDGNIHYTVLPPAGASPGQLAAAQDAVHALAEELGGSFSAEHGIGADKPRILAQLRPAAELALMAGLKRLLDPRGILNPGKVLA